MKNISTSALPDIRNKELETCLGNDFSETVKNHKAIMAGSTAYREAIPTKPCPLTLTGKEVNYCQYILLN